MLHHGHPYLLRFDQGRGDVFQGSGARAPRHRARGGDVVRRRVRLRLTRTSSDSAVVSLSGSAAGADRRGWPATSGGRCTKLLPGHVRGRLGASLPLRSVTNGAWSPSSTLDSLEPPAGQGAGAV